MSSVKIILMAFTAGLEQLPSCKQTHSFSLIKIVEQDPVLTDLLWETIMVGTWVR